MESIFAGWQFYVLGVALFAVTSTIRNTAEAIWPRLEINRAWNKAALPAIPLALGVAFGFVKGFPWPAAVGEGNGGHVAFGLVAAVFSSNVYARVKDLMASGTGQPPASTPPSV